VARQYGRNGMKDLIEKLQAHVECPSCRFNFKDATALEAAAALREFRCVLPPERKTQETPKETP
jgi:hypothetical protein